MIIKTLSAPEISIYDPDGAEKRVIIAVPTDIPFQGKTLSVCFMAIDMDEMLSGVSMSTHSGNATFCNLYTSVLTVTAMLVMFGFIIGQAKRHSRLLPEHETTEVENRVKQEALEQQPALQEQLLAEERRREQQDQMTGTVLLILPVLSVVCSVNTSQPTLRQYLVHVAQSRFF